jgi:hypothetical protein
MPPLRNRTPHPAAGPGAPARPPPGLPQARHLTLRAGSPAVQRQRLPRHPGRRAPGPPAPPPLHRRAAGLLQGPSTPQARTTARGSAGRWPSSSPTPGRSLSQARRHCSRLRPARKPSPQSRQPTSAAKDRPEQSSLTRATQFTAGNGQSGHRCRYGLT